MFRPYASHPYCPNIELRKFTPLLLNPDFRVVVGHPAEQIIYHAEKEGVDHAQFCMSILDIVQAA